MEQKTKNVNSHSLSFTTNDIIQVGLMAAIIFVATSLIHIPSFMGVVHLGDSMVFLSAILLRRKKATAASAIGMALFDLLNGYTAWAPFTFIIKGLMAYIAGTIVYRRDYNGNKMVNNILAFAIAGIFMIAAYYFSGVIMAKFIVVKAATINQAFILAIKDIPGNIAQVVAGIIIAVPLTLSLKKFKF